MNDNEEDVPVHGTLIYETVDAWRIEVAAMGQKDPSSVWLPKSKCERTNLNEWNVPQWLAKKEGLI